MIRLTKKSLPPFNYALKDGSDAEIGYFKNYDAFFSHMMVVKRLGELEDLFEELEKEGKLIVNNGTMNIKL